MKIEQIYTNCLAEAAYYIESDGEVAIVDPLRETQPYLNRAAQSQAKIKYIFETHFHADFVSGHVELANKTGAKIVYGPTAKTNFEAHIATDGEQFKLGKITIVALHTPGHTPESTTFLLKDENGEDHCIFTGDTLFIGDVGRPDLAQQGSQTIEDMAGILYDSLHSKIMPLANHVLIYPAHGAGSACGKSMSKETFATLGNQKEYNYALRAQSKTQFIKEVTDGILPPPAYFAANAKLNKTGYKHLDDVFEKGLNALDPDRFEQLAHRYNALVIDTRDAAVFATGFIPKSVNIGLNGQFAPWVGALISDLKQPILLVVDKDKAEEAVTRLARVGYDNTLGFLDGGIEAWQKADKVIDKITHIDAVSFAEKIKEGEPLKVIDVRKPNEYNSGHLVAAISCPLDYINDWTAQMDPAETYFVHCAGGYRSMVASSILKARGIKNVVDVAGGYGAIKQTTLPRTDL